MTHKKTWGWALLCLLLICLPVFAQETAVKGNISGVVQDSTGAVVPAAKVSLTGPQGERVATTEADGRFLFSLLQPGAYGIKVEKQGFRASEVKGVVVDIGKTTSLALKLEPGAVGEVIEVTGNATTVDTTSTAVGADLSDTFYQQVPVARNVASLFYVAPGAADSGGAGHANPSISGASGLENLYMADGVNITDSAYGGLGTFTRRQGSIGSGINLSFIKEVSVKTGGFEPQYGEATGGVVQLVTKSGSNQWHGEIGGYAAPQGAEGTFLQTDLARTNKRGTYNGNANYDADGQLGGYVPGFKNHLFFFGDFNPSWGQQFVQSPPTAGLAALGQLTLFARTYNYAGKLTFRLNDNHQFEGSVFGDPTKTNATAQNWVLNTPNNTGFSKWDYGSRNVVARYNGTLSPTWLVNGSFTWEHGHFTESPRFDVLQVVDNTVSTSIHTLQGFGFLENNTVDSYAVNADTQKIFHLAGEHTFSIGYRYERPSYDDITASSGGKFAVPLSNSSGGDYLGCTQGDQACPKGGQMFLWNGSLNDETGNGCTACPMYTNSNGQKIPVAVQFGRGRFDSGVTPTFGRYNAGYVNDAWQMSKYITLSAGIRWEQWKMAGTGSSYTFTDNWAPRVGVSIDPLGDRKTKIYGNFGRYNYKTPLDAAIRSLSGEKDLTKMVIAPEADASGNVIINPNGSINVVPDAAHTLNNAVGGVAQNPGISASLTGGEGFAPGAKMMYQDEFLVGVEHQFKGGLVLSGRFIYRDMPRIVEDMAGLSPEAFNLRTPNTNQLYFIGNPGPKIDLFPNEHSQSVVVGQPIPAPCNNPANIWNKTTNPNGTAFMVAPGGITDANGGSINPSTGGAWNNGNGLCWSKINGFWGGEQTATGAPIPDGQPDGFPAPIHIYKAVEIEANKAFSHNWMLRANWRIASLQGNYEGAFRNDNLQTDPNISSLFDFTNGIIGMLGDQYKKGPLNTDRRHIVNIYTSYVVPSGFLKALELGGGVNILSGSPISNLADHPAYGNAGEVPLGIRGIEGRTPVSGGVNAHIEKPFKITERYSLRVAADLFNITNARPVTLVDQLDGISFNPAPNPDFLKVQRWDINGPGPGYTGYQKPFYARFSARLVF
jgi:hypothetical protein